MIEFEVPFFLPWLSADFWFIAGYGFLVSIALAFVSSVGSLMIEFLNRLRSNHSRIMALKEDLSTTTTDAEEEDE